MSTASQTADSAEAPRELAGIDAPMEPLTADQRTVIDHLMAMGKLPVEEHPKNAAAFLEGLDEKHEALLKDKPAMIELLQHDDIENSGDASRGYGMFTEYLNSADIPTQAAAATGDGAKVEDLLKPERDEQARVLAEKAAVGKKLEDNASAVKDSSNAQAADAGKFQEVLRDEAVAAPKAANKQKEGDALTRESTDASRAEEEKAMLAKAEQMQRDAHKGRGLPGEGGGSGGNVGSALMGAAGTVLGGLGALIKSGFTDKSAERHEDMVQKNLAMNTLAINDREGALRAKVPYFMDRFHDAKHAHENSVLAVETAYPESTGFLKTHGVDGINGDPALMTALQSSLAKEGGANKYNAMIDAVNEKEGHLLDLTREALARCEKSGNPDGIEEVQEAVVDACDHGNPLAKLREDGGVAKLDDAEKKNNKKLMDRLMEMFQKMFARFGLGKKPAP